MKIEVKCTCCDSIVKVERFCKIIDERCRNVEDGGFNWVKWCNIPCAKEGGPLLSRREQTKLDKKKEEERLQAEALRKQLKRREDCKHPNEWIIQIAYWYSYGPHRRFKCRICEKIWETFYGNCPNYQGLGD